MEEALDWVSYRMMPGINEAFKKDLFQLVDAVLEPIEDLSRMVAEVKKYFETYSDKQRAIVKDIINNLRKREHEADGIEGGAETQNIFTGKRSCGCITWRKTR